MYSFIIAVGVVAFSLLYRGLKPKPQANRKKDYMSIGTTCFTQLGIQKIFIDMEWYRINRIIDQITDLDDDDLHSLNLMLELEYLNKKVESQKVEDQTTLNQNIATTPEMDLPEIEDSPYEHLEDKKVETEPVAKTPDTNTSEDTEPVAKTPDNNPPADDDYDQDQLANQTKLKDLCNPIVLLIHKYHHGDIITPLELARKMKENHHC